jgi:hypothetical protein
MARSPSRLGRLLRGSLALPGALLDAVRPRPAAAPEPLLLRLRSVLERFGDDEQAGPVTATYSEVRVYGGPRRADLGGSDPALAVREAEPLDRDFDDARAELARGLGALGATARAIALALAGRLDADLAGLEAGLDALTLPARSRRKRRRAIARLERLLAEARSLDVVPGRGRRRDLKRVARTVKRLKRLGTKAGMPRRRPLALTPRR